MMKELSLVSGFRELPLLPTRGHDTRDSNMTIDEDQEDRHALGQLDGQLDDILG